MTVIQCTHADCGKPCRVSPDVIGRSVKCRSCRRMFVAAACAADSTADQPGESTLPLPASPRSVKRSGGDSAGASRLPLRIGRFEILDQLGFGAFGKVYRAYDPQLEREVAVKVPQTGWQTSPEFVERFLREARAAARLNHPHIVPVYDAGQDGDQSYIASAFIRGKSLSDRVADFSGDYRRIAKVIARLAEALHYAHTQTIIHRDVKPQNVMIDLDDQPHLMDFGLAHVGGDARKLTHDGTLLGTPAYMSPEQAAAGDEVTAASDQYSLGVALFELLTRETPFAGSPSVVIYNILNSPLPSPRSLNPEIPRDLETICLKALSKEPQGRYQNCGEFAADLERWLQDRPIAARRQSAVEQVVRWCRRNPLAATLSAAVLAAILIGGGVSTAFGLIAQQRAAALSAALSDVSTQKTRANEKADEARTALAQLEPEQKRAQQNASEATLIRAIAICEQGDIAWGLLELCRALEFAERAENSALIEAINWNISAWSAYSPRLQALLPHPAEVTCLAATSDGASMIIGCRDGNVRIWSTADFSASPIELPHPAEIHGLAVWPDSTRFVTLCADGQFRVWDMESRRVLSSGRLPGPTTMNDHLSKVSCDPTSHRFAVGSWSGAAVCDSDTGQIVTTLMSIPTEAVCFLPDGRLSTLDNGTRFQIWSKGDYRPEGPPIKTAEGDGVRSVTLAASANSAFAGGGHLLDHAAILLQLRQPGALTRIRHAGTVTSVAFSPDSGLFFSGSEGKIKLYDLQLMAPVPGWMRHPGMVRAIVCFGGQGRFATAGGDAAVRVWQTPQRHHRRQLASSERVSDLGFSPDGTRLATACGYMKPELRLWDSESGKLLREIEPGREGVRAIAFAPDGKSAYIAYVPTPGRGAIYRWDLSDSFPRDALAQYPGEIWRLELSPDGEVLGFGTWDGVGYGTLLTRTNKLTLVPDARHAHILGVSLSPDGRFLLAGGHDRQAVLSEARDSTRVLWRREQGTQIAASAFHPSGGGYFLGGTDGVIRQYDLATHASSGPSMRHEASVVRLRFTPDGRLLASASGDGTARFWHVGSGQTVGPVLRMDHSLYSLAIHPRGTQAATGDDKGNIGLWSIPPVGVSRTGADQKLTTEVATGMTLDDDLGVRVLDNDEWRTKFRRLAPNADRAPRNSESAAGDLATVPAESVDSTADENGPVRLTLDVPDGPVAKIRVTILDQTFRVLAKLENAPPGPAELPVSSVPDGKYVVYFDSPGYDLEMKRLTVYQGYGVPGELTATLHRKKYVVLRYAHGVADSPDPSAPTNRLAGAGVDNHRVAVTFGGRFRHFTLSRKIPVPDAGENSPLLTINCPTAGVGFARPPAQVGFDELDLAPPDSDYPLRQIPAEPGATLLCRVCRGPRPGWDYGKLVVEAVADSPPPDIPLLEWQHPADFIGKQFLVELTGTQEGNLWGSDPFTGDSSPAKAAVHAGLLKLGETETLLVTVVEPPESFPGTSQNGIASNAWARFPSAFTLRRPTAEERQTLRTAPAGSFYLELNRGP